MYFICMVFFCGLLDFNCNYVGYKLFIVMFYNEKCIFQDLIYSNGFFDLKYDYGNKIIIKMDIFFLVDYFFLEIKVSFDFFDY